MEKVKHIKRILIIGSIVLSFVVGGKAAAGAGEKKIRTPYLQIQGDAKQLIVDGKPFLILGGELGNSTASSIEYMKPIWPKLARRRISDFSLQ